MCEIAPDNRAVPRRTFGDIRIIGSQAWGQGDATTLGTVQHPLLVVNGDNDVMVPSFNSFELARRLPNAQLSIFPDAGHGGIVAIRNKAPQQ
jgi:pimeloyl-ACP methyl ester carboxylesterase